jgi:flagellar biosynthesis/type III secretory pathway chaperone
MSELNMILRIKYQEVIRLWEEFCELHNELYILTCDEYSYLLESNIEAVEENLIKKQTLLQTIHDVEDLRQQLIVEINDANLTPNKINNISDLISLMNNVEKELKVNHLERYNNLLIDIIGKIQLQNKSNQIFLNKALISIREMKEQFMGKKQYKTYGASGNTVAVTTK